MSKDCAGHDCQEAGTARGILEAANQTVSDRAWDVNSSYLAPESIHSPLLTLKIKLMVILPAKNGFIQE